MLELGSTWIDLDESGLNWIDLIESGLNWIDLIESGLNWIDLIESGLSLFKFTARERKASTQVLFIHPFLLAFLLHCKYVVLNELSSPITTLYGRRA
jgi:hypothetical protein